MNPQLLAGPATVGFGGPPGFSLSRIPRAQHNYQDVNDSGGSLWQDAGTVLIKAMNMIKR